MAGIKLLTAARINISEQQSCLPSQRLSVTSVARTHVTISVALFLHDGARHGKRLSLGFAAGHDTASRVERRSDAATTSKTSSSDQISAQDALTVIDKLRQHVTSHSDTRCAAPLYKKDLLVKFAHWLYRCHEPGDVK